MKAYKATIFHAGKQNHQITKENLSASEIIILKAVHGAHAVVDIFDSGSEKIIEYKQNDENGKEVSFTRPATINDEKAFLADRYGAKVFGETFPGAMPVLPTDLAQVGIEYVHSGQVSAFEATPEPTEAPAEETGGGDEGEGDGLPETAKKSKMPKFLGG